MFQHSEKFVPIHLCCLRGNVEKSSIKKKEMCFFSSLEQRIEKCCFKPHENVLLISHSFDYLLMVDWCDPMNFTNLLILKSQK